MPNLHPLAYRTYDQALAARMNLGAQVAVDLEIVKCDECRKWHVVKASGQQSKTK